MTNTVADPQAPTTNNQDHQVYKRWHKFGFINIGYWPKPGNKFTIEIGRTAGETKQLESVTKCWIPPMEWLAYLRAEVNGTLDRMYPDFSQKGLAFFGGSKTKDGIVSRVFKISPFKDREGVVNPHAREFRCAHMPGQANSMGAIMPLKGVETLSDDRIKISITEIGEIFESTLLKIYSETINADLDD